MITPTLKRKPEGVQVWPSAVERLCSLAAKNENIIQQSEALLDVAMDLTQRDMRDIELLGRRVQTSDYRDAKAEAYFAMLEVLGLLEAVVSQDNSVEYKIIRDTAMQLTAHFRSKTYGHEKT
jgi:hypothetical protein